MDLSKYDITPEQEASMSQYFHRQLLTKTQPVTKNEVDLTGKTAIVTGSNIGLGLEASRQLLDLGLGRLILAVRTISKGEAARDDLLSGRTETPEIEVWPLDLASYKSVTDFAERANGLDHVDIAILNAGIFKKDEEFSSETGVEMDVQINYLSTTLLSLLLLPVLKASPSHPAGRLVIVSSDMGGWFPLSAGPDEPILSVYKKKATTWNAPARYGESKLLGQLFVTELARRIPASVVTVDAVNPGFSHGTGLQREGTGVLGFLFRGVSRAIGKPPYVCARTIVHAAVKFGDEVHGEYVEEGKIRPKAPMIYKPGGPVAAQKLWDETMAELSFAQVQEAVASS
ncbi:putative short-chain dehydrogenase [Stachybotrys elegans]|uniref:Short-chain dehydrogenase n=1 Tax=Stachybotrys elegans TaxID=80388 RepID=A0A8K0WMI1_9HYPO|nr:putative short-chain dehydrogenase [Stachybotrys elegans]